MMPHTEYAFLRKYHRSQVANLLTELCTCRVTACHPIRQVPTLARPEAIGLYQRVLVCMLMLLP